MAKPLVIVESPAKAKTLSRFLGGKYRVEASVGHVRDLPERASEVPQEIKDKPWGRMAVDVDGDFKPYYVVPLAKKKRISELKAAVKEASEVLLATDPDREGESISAHLQEILKPKVPTHRIVFHEITEEAVREALAHKRDVDAHLVKAQEGRRILDRLYGYTLSPVLWKKVQTGLSAGRVQSVAVRLIVEREEERRAFRKAAFWDLEARIAAEGREFTATLVRLGDKRVASGKDFDPTTGRLKESAARLLTEADARALATDLSGRLPWTITGVDERPTTQRPSPPFTTSTLQQEANRKLGFSADRTMKAAQGLHDEGLISYHRTDSTTLSQKALGEAERAIKDIYGAEYHTGSRQYQTKVRNAQEAHEAIRPTDFNRRPQQMSGLDPDEARVYELIWMRAIASQMADARLLRTNVEITGRTAAGEDALFTASGKAIQFAGFLRAYVEGSDDPAAALDDQETILPALTRGQSIARAEAGARGATLAALDPKGHETTPPARYTDASLVKRLEDESIGRPSTYASIISTILRRGYVFRQGKALVPSFTAFAVTGLLKNHFGDYIDLGFTAEMEEDLDQIASGERTSFDFVREFYRGTKGRPGLEQRAQGDEQIPYPAVDLGTDAGSGLPIRVRIGRFGPFLQRGEGGEGHTASLPDEIAPADFQVEHAVELLNAKAEGPRTLGAHPQTGENVYLLTGRFGPYVQLGEMPEKGAKGTKAVKPKRASLPKSLFTEDTLTLDQALQLLSLPREVGKHPDDGEPIVANFGPYAPYVKHKTEYRSLDSEAAVFDVTLDQAVELFRQPKKSRRQSVSRTVLNPLGPRPGTEKPMQVLSGRYGPYVTDGTTHASLPKGADPATITIAEADELLKAREAMGPSTRKGARKGAGPRRAPAKRAPAGARKRA